MSKKIDRKKMLELINESNGKIFTVKFKKRSDGTNREMVCRLGVKSHLADPDNPKPAYNFKEHQLIPVFDMQKQAYRSIPVGGVYYIKINGVEYKLIN